MTPSLVPLKTSTVALLGLSLGLIPPVEAALVATSGTLNLTIPDGQQAGINTSLSIDAPSQFVQSVRVSIQIQGTGIGGAWNGDFYAALVRDNRRAVLLNRPGVTPSNPVGYPDNGFNVTFDDTADRDIHLYGETTVPTLPLPLTGTWQPDARAALPSAVSSTTPRELFLSEFQGLPASGNWFLVIADNEFGGTARLAGWSLEITAVPEPAAGAAAIGAALLGLGWYRATRRNQPKRPESTALSP